MTSALRRAIFSVGSRRPFADTINSTIIGWSIQAGRAQVQPGQRSKLTFQQQHTFSSSATSPPPERNITDIVRKLSAVPDAPALVVCHQGVRWSFSELTDRALRLASALEDLGYQRGQRLGILLQNSKENVITQLAAALLGCDLVTAKTGEDLKQMVKDLSCRGVMTSAADVDIALEAKDMCHHHPIIVGGDFSSAPDCLHFELLSQAYLPLALTHQPDSTSSFYYASKKGVSVDDLVSQGSKVVEALKLGASDRICLPITLNHSMGTGFGLMAALQVGCTVVIPSGAPEVGATLSALKQEQCTILFADSHTLKALPSDVEAASEGMGALRGGVTKIGSGEEIGLCNNRMFAGVGLLTVGKPPVAKN